MSGQSILNTWLKNNDPVRYVLKAFEICTKYNTKPKYFNRLKKWWVEKISYPIFRYKVRKSEIKTSLILYDHPDLLIFILSRFLLALKTYSDLSKLTIEYVLDVLFPNNAISLSLQTNPISFNKNELSLIGYELVVRTYISNNIDAKEEDYKYTLTTINTDIIKQTYTISQIVYDTNDESTFSTAKIIHKKEFKLGADGKLYNPNYVLDKTLLEEDLISYKLIISQIMAFIGGFFDEITKLYFIKPKAN